MLRKAGPRKLCAFFVTKALVDAAHPEQRTILGHFLQNEIEGANAARGHQRRGKRCA